MYILKKIFLNNLNRFKNCRFNQWVCKKTSFSIQINWGSGINYFNNDLLNLFLPSTKKMETKASVSWQFLFIGLQR